MKKKWKTQWKIELQKRSNLKKIGNKNKKLLKHVFKHESLPTVLGLLAKNVRDPLIKHLSDLEKHHVSKTPCYLDFKKVKILHPEGTIYLLHHLHKYDDLNLLGRTSDDTTVRAMLSKLKIHEMMDLPEYTKEHELVDQWHIFKGNSATFDDRYLEIEKVLQDTFGEESELFYTLNDAIGEAVTNAVHHAYEPHEKYKTWILFLSISPTKCSVIVSDLGKTIPVSAPIKLADKMRVPSIIFKGITDQDCIEIVTTWRRSSTNLSHRGRGFDNILQVCNEGKGAIVRVLSRKGGWSTKEGKLPYSNAIKGTIISWVIPLLSTDDKEAA